MKIRLLKIIQCRFCIYSIKFYIFNKTVLNILKTHQCCKNTIKTKQNCFNFYFSKHLLISYAKVFVITCASISAVGLYIILIYPFSCAFCEQWYRISAFCILFRWQMFFENCIALRPSQYILVGLRTRFRNPI